MASGPRFKDMTLEKRLAVAADLRMYSTFFLTHKYGISARTVANWRQYADARPPGDRRFRQKRPEPECEIEAVTVCDSLGGDERDEIRTRCYREVQMSNGGITGDEVARLTGFSLADVERELIDMSRKRCDCRLVYCEAGIWKAVDVNSWNVSEEGGIRRYKITGRKFIEAA